jgi:hypothetical protein
MEKIMLRDVEIENAHLIHPWMLAIFDYLLEHEPTRKLERIIIKAEGGPKGLFGRYYPDLALFVINLEHIFEKAVADAKKSTGEILSIAAIVWMNTIWTFGHELHHAVAFATDTDGLLENEDYLKKEDEEADAYGDECVKTIARLNLNIEPPAIADMPYFGVKVMEMVTTAIQNREQWGETHQEMISKGYAYSAINFDLVSLREYIRMVHGRPDWEESTEKVVVKEKTMAIGETQTDTFDNSDEIDYEGAHDEAVDAYAAANPTGGPAILMDGPQTPAQPTPVADEMAEVHYEGFLDMDYIDGVGDGTGGEEYTVNVEGYTSHQAVAAPAEVSPAPATAPAPAGHTHPSFAQPAGMAAINEGDAQTAHAVYRKLIDYLFDVVFDPRGTWKNANALWTPVDITDITGAAQMFLAYNTNMGGKDPRESIPANGGLVGRTFSEHTLCGYDVVMVASGQSMKRRIIVQNPRTQSRFALMARAGRKVVWIIDISSNKWLGHYEDGVWHPK